MRFDSNVRSTFWLALCLPALLMLGGCPAGTGSTANSNTGTNVDEGGAGQRPVPDACFPAGTGGGATPAGEAVFPTQGATVDSGGVNFLFRGSDPDGDPLAITVFVSDQPNVFDAFPIAQLACGTAEDVEQNLAIGLPSPGSFFWGIEVSDGLNTIRRPADGVGVPFNAVPSATPRSGLDAAVLLCPIEALPARSATTFQWSLGGFAAAKAQVFVGRANQDSPFDNPLRVFEVTPPTDTSLTVPAVEALPVGDPLTWGLRVEAVDGVAFTLGGTAGETFVPQANVPPSGTLLSPPNDAVLADGADAFVLSWDADAGNCEDTLSSTLFLAPVGPTGVPEDLFNSARRLIVGGGGLESNIVASLDALSLPAGTWAWGVRASDGTDQTAATDSGDATRNFRTFIRDTSPRFVTAPAVGDGDCGAGVADALLLSYIDDNGLAGLSVTVSYSSNRGSVFTNPEATTEFDAGVVGDSLVLRLSDPAGNTCPVFAQGAGNYGVQLSDGVNDPVRVVVVYAGPRGACCNPDGSCVDDLAGACEGVYQGDRSACAEANCPQPVGACCIEDGSCTEGTAANCPGAYQGDDTTCVEAACPQPVGACCLGDGRCIESTQDDCRGTYQGDDTLCGDANCPQPPPPPPPPVSGACCDLDGFCTDNVPQSQCSGAFDRFAANTACEVLEPPCEPQLGACCVQGECVDTVSRLLCEEEFGGMWFIGEDCDCRGDGECFQCPLPLCAWDNGSGNPGQTGRELSPPAFPERRVVDDVFFQNACTIDKLHVEVAEDDGWQAGGTVTVFVYNSGGKEGEPTGAPRNLITGPFTRISTGEDYFGRSMFRYEMENLGIDLGTSETVFIGFRNDGGSGQGTNFWMDSNGGIDGGKSGPPWYSDDDGDSWMLDTELQRAFTIVGGGGP